MDVGCGMGTALRAMAGDFDRLIGVDPDLCDLIIARKVLEEEGIEDVLLVCGCAESMPIRDDVCDLAIGLNVVEHFSDQGQAIREVLRVLKKGGFFFFDSKNRFDPFRLEPHVLLPLVGFLPRGLARRYVKAIRGQDYDVRLLSRFELRSILGNNPFIQSYTIQVRSPVHDPRFEHLLLAWKAVTGLPILGKLVEMFAPSYDVVITE
jgi:ubiquinone/menaquinone biosynthesis C-methylase UbiE